MDIKSPIARAIEVAGSQHALADEVGTKQQNVSKWLKKGRPTTEFVLAIEKATNVSRYELRPDIYGPAPPPAEDAAA